MEERNTEQEKPTDDEASALDALVSELCALRKEYHTAPWNITKVEKRNGETWIAFPCLDGAFGMSKKAEIEHVKTLIADLRKRMPVSR